MLDVHETLQEHLVKIKSFLNTKVIRIDPAIGNSYIHVLYHFGKPRASLEYAKSSIFDFRPSTKVFVIQTFDFRSVDIASFRAYEMMRLQ